MRKVFCAVAFAGLATVAAFAQAPPVNAVAPTGKWGPTPTPPSGQIWYTWEGTSSYDNTMYASPQVVASRVTWNATTNKWDMVPGTDKNFIPNAAGAWGNGSFGMPYVKGQEVNIKAELKCVKTGTMFPVIHVADSIQTTKMP